MFTLWYLLHIVYISLEPFKKISLKAGPHAGWSWQVLKLNWSLQWFVCCCCSLISSKYRCCCSLQLPSHRLQIKLDAALRPISWLHGVWFAKSMKCIAQQTTLIQLFECCNPWHCGALVSGILAIKMCPFEDERIWIDAFPQAEIVFSCLTAPTGALVVMIHH